MSLLLPEQKHKLEGIGGASAISVLALIGSNPSMAFLTQGIAGKILYYSLTKGFSFLASGGLVMANVGIERVLTAIDKHGFDGSWDDAQKIIDDITGRQQREMTPQEVIDIDNIVKDSFRKFGKLGKKKKD